MRQFQSDLRAGRKGADGKSSNGQYRCHPNCFEKCLHSFLLEVFYPIKIFIGTIIMLGKATNSARSIR